MTRTARYAFITIAGVLAFTAGAARAQLAGVSVSSAGATCSGGGGSEGDCLNSAAIVTSNPSQFSTHYAWNINADAVGGSHVTSGTAEHSISFTATAPGAYKLSIQTQRVGDLNRVEDDPGCSGSVDISGVSGSSNVAISSGSLNLADPGSIAAGSGDTSVPFNHLGAATIINVSNGVPQNHTLTFTWSGAADSATCETAVRLGESSGSTLDCPGCGYPGTPARAQGGDGHFVTVVFTSLCGNGIVDVAGGEQCDEGAGNGSPSSCCTSTCQFRNAGEVCRDSAGVCDPEETCSGSAGTCPADAKSTALCRAAAGECDIAESCDGVNDDCPADAKSTAVCRTSAGICDIAESCDGVSDVCPGDAFEPDSTTCRAAAGVCDLAEQCTGSSADCPADAKSTLECRAEAGDCDIAEICDGVSDNCPADAVKPAGFVCNPGSGDLCDPDEVCDGVDNQCPADTITAGGTVCRAGSGDVCDPDEVCSGTADDPCPPDAFASAGSVCRPGSGDLCDPDEVCPGVPTGTCAADVVTPAGTVCRPGSGDLCDPDEQCTGNPTEPCPADAVEPSTTVCRPGSGDMCDPDEFCPGVAGGTCAAEVVLPPTTVCRPGSGDLCDPDEFCPGVAAGTCAADVVAPAGTVCNPGSGDLCDPDEVCSGTAGEACPADTVEPASTECRAAAGECDVADFCPGTPDGECGADVKEPTSTVCRAAADVCDAEETCDGSNNDCPADGDQPDGTSCSDGLFCNGEETCQAGECTDQSDPCGFAVLCSEGTDTCLSEVCPSAPQSCRTAQKSLLLVKNKTDDSKDKLIWKWIKGAATTAEEFADPRATAEYALCIYAGTTDTLVAQVHIPPSNTKWKAAGSKGYKYLDQTFAADGAQKVLVKSGANGKAKALLKGRGANLPDPLDLGPLGTPVTAQLLNYESGVCWQGTYTTAKKDNATIFKAKTP